MELVQVANNVASLLRHWMVWCSVVVALFCFAHASKGKAVSRVGVLGKRVRSNWGHTGTENVNCRPTIADIPSILV